MKRQCWQPSSRLIRERLEKKQQQKHVEKILKVTSSIDMRKPNCIAIQAKKNKTGDAKKKRLEEEKKNMIKKENDRLIRKLLDLDPSTRMQRYRMFNSDVSGQRQQRMQIASIARRRKAAEKINKQNREMLRRIVNIKATFTRQAWKSEEKRRKKLKQNLRQNSMNRQGNSPRYTPRITPRVVVKKKTVVKKKKKLIRPKTAPARSTRRVVRKKKSTGGLKKQSNSNNSNSNMKVTTTRMKRPQSAKPSSRVAIDVTADINNANLVQA